MPSVVRIAFPFRRLAIWLSVLVLAVAGLALGISALLVLPSLRSNLVSDRRAQLAAAADPWVTQFSRADTVAEWEKIATAYEELTGQQAVVLDSAGSGSFLPIAGHLPGSLEDPLVAAAHERRTRQLGVVDVEGRYAAEVAVPSTGNRYVLLFSASLNDVDRTVETVRHDIVLATAIGLPAAWIVGLLAAFALSIRIRRLDRAARSIAAGNLSTPVVDDGRDEIHDLAEAFDHMRRRIERTDRARREFVAIASHELRTPLFALGGFLELLEDEEDADAQREYLQTMRAQVGRLTRLATDLLDLSRLDAGAVELERATVDLVSVATMLADDFAAAATARGATIEAAVSGDVVSTADETRVAQIGRILVDNALKHNPVGTHVRVVAENTAAGPALVVVDDGAAIETAAAEQIFDRFYRGGSAEGSGLGLAIAKELAGRMGGGLSLEQTPGAERGKAFRLSLPAAVAQPPTKVRA
jgi:signal transduction histidine kinase